jgi:prophage DNA circulation protein
MAAVATTSAWKKKLQRGRFRDAEFFAESSDCELGRRIAMHEFPLRDKPFAEDMGRKARQWTLEIYVIGADYMAARDKIIAALEEPGSGTLVHPYLGTKQVVVSGARGPSESTSDGGMARFSVTFTEAGENSQPATSINTAAIVGQRSDLAITAIETGFADRFTLSGVAGFVGSAAEGVAGSALELIGDAADMMPTVPTGISSFAGTLLRTGSSLASLIRTPSLFAGQISGMVSSLAGLPLRPKAALDSYKSLWGFGSSASGSSPSSYSTPLPVVPRTTPSRIIQADNQAAIVDLVRQSAVVESARTASTLTYGQDGDVVSYQEAVGIRDSIIEQIDEELITADDATYVALTDLRAAVVQDINTRGADLARLNSYTPGVTLPSVVLSHRLYGDATHAEELVGRNNISHPGFIPGGQAIEVVSHA